MSKRGKIAVITFLMIAFAGTGFYAGMQYGINKKATQISQGGRGVSFSGLANGNNQRGSVQGGQRIAGQGNNGGDFTGGQIVAKDDTSITIKTKNGSSQILFYSPSITIDKSVLGTATDLNVGQQITASGKVNQDGSIVAANIQIRQSINN